MSVRLAFGVTAGPELGCWLPTSGGSALPVDGRAAHPPGAPVVVGPGGADPEEAVARLALLVAGGSEVAAGAGVDLGRGFTSARLAGAPGDRRDAVLAVLRFLGTEGAHRLGDRNGVLVALFGLSATKRVGAAAHTAIADERWAALQLASALSDLLGPEQVERVLELRAPDGIDPFPRGAASTLADHLSRVLTPYQRPRRLALVVSLWEHVCARLLDRQRLARLAASQTRADRIDRLRKRHREHFDEPLARQVTYNVGATPSVAAVARWRPPLSWTANELGRLLHDAIAATALLRFARTMAGEGLAVAAEKHRDELVAADACLSQAERAAATRRELGDYSHPARPGRYLHDLLQPLRPGRGITSKTEVYVRERVGMARNYGVVVLDAVTELVDNLGGQPLHNCWDTCKPWQAPRLRQWRAAMGFRRAPGGWEQPPLADAHADGPKQTLARRMAADPGADPVSLETPHDLLWYADLADALAPVHGNEAATVRHALPAPELDYARPREVDRVDSIPLAVAGIAQLVAFGATPPPRCGSWPALADGVRTDAAVAEASVGTFPVPPEMSAVDKQVVPGTGLSVELGREPRQLAGWSSYMGNCIGESWYAERAQRGRCVLMALRDRGDGRIVANLDIRRHASGWRVHELRARFNAVVDPALEQHVKRWVDTLAPPKPATPAPALPEPRVRSRGGAARRSAAERLPAELTRALTTEVARTLAGAAAARRTYAVLASGLGRRADFEPDAAVIALKRLGPVQHVALLRTALDDGLGVAALWRATRVRPLAAAVDRLDPGPRAYDRLTTLTGGVPLPRTLRALVRRPEIAPAHAMDVVARAVRRAMGELLGDDALVRSVARRPSPELVCALVVATTCAAVNGTVRLTAPGTTAVPGFPATDLFDEQGPWQQALPAAADLGAPVAYFGERVAEHGLRAPAALLGRGGWPALWRRAHG
ncbi:hypothetical protein [Actinophytocola sp.]|uniref:hypothetical protein n=1 Tax=Actinophytocola sp. TaxID=1872138 RepID=UPI00389A9F00